MKLILIVLFFVWAVEAQKPGTCIPPTGAGICAFTCSDDNECSGSQKCCKTGCGGTSCQEPKSEPPMRRQYGRSKSGDCPAQPTGAWVCTDMCTDDTDCRGGLKCCKNRCGALACQEPE